MQTSISSESEHDAFAEKGRGLITLVPREIRSNGTAARAEVENPGSVPISAFIPRLPIGELRCSRTFACAWPAMAVSNASASAWARESDERHAVDEAWQAALSLGAAEAGLLRPSGTCPVCWGRDLSGAMEELLAPCRPPSRPSVEYMEARVFADVAAASIAIRGLDRVDPQ